MVHRWPHSAGQTVSSSIRVPSPAPGSEEEWLGIATRVFGGRVLFGEDLTRVSTESG